MEEVQKLRAQIAAMPTAPTTTVINNTMIINKVNYFMKEDLAHITHDRFRELLKQANLEDSLQELVKMVHFDSGHPQNANVYMHDVDAPHGFLWWGQDDGWKRVSRDELIRRVLCNMSNKMTEHSDEPFEKEYTDAEIWRQERFLQNILFEPRPSEETRRTIVENKHVVELHHPSWGSLRECLVN